MASSGRDDLHRLIEDLPSSEIAAARDLLRFLNRNGSDPVLRALVTAALDDELEEEDGLEEAREEYTSGDTLSHDEVLKDLGI